MKAVIRPILTRLFIPTCILFLGAASVAYASGLLSNVPEASSYNLVYELQIDTTCLGWNGVPVPYTVDNSATVKTGSFTRIAYYLELVSLSGTTTNWVYVSMDAFTNDPTKIGVPNVASGEFYNYQNTVISNANIFSSDNGLITPGTGVNTVNIEFWPSNYGQGNDYGVPGASVSTFDFGDGGASTNAGHACMQLHNYGLGQTLFAYNHWGPSGTPEIGIGTQVGGSGNPDWTFNGTNVNNFSARTLQVLVRGLPSINNSGGATGITATTAYLNGSLTSTGSSPVSVWLFWGTNDAGTVKAAWGNTNFFGLNVAVPPVPFSTNVSGLLPNTNYYYRFCASNAQGQAWVDTTATFRTLPSFPVVNNANGATAVASVSAFLNCTLVSTGIAPTSVWILSGAADGGTNFAGWSRTNSLGPCGVGSLSTSIGGLIANSTYYYCSYASNLFGAAWASTSSVFITGQVTIQATASNAAEAGPVPGRFTVYRPATATNIPFTVSYSIGGSALNGVDYQGISNYVVIPAGSTNVDINIMPIDDPIIEGTETVALSLLPGPYIPGAASNATVSIADNDFKGGCRMKLKILFSGYKPPGGTSILSNFPALVILNESYFRFSYRDFYSPGNGGDLRFMNSNETVYLNYQIDDWNTNGNSLIWVQVPELVDSNTAIWVYWRSPTETNALPCTTNGATWDSSFVGVWHMKETNSLDSTSNRFTGASRYNISTNGMIDGAQSFVTVDSSVDLAAGMATQFVSNVTVEAFTFLNGYAGSAPCIFTERHNGSGILFSMGFQNSSNLFAGWWISNIWYQAIDPYPMATSQWVYVSGSYDGNNIRLYRNGALMQMSSYVARQLPSSGAGFRLGHRWDGTESWNGTIDEVRLSNVARSPAWLWASWMNQVSNSVFNSYGFGMDGVPRGTSITVK